MSNVYWILEYCATFSEFFLGTIFCGSFIENTDLKDTLLKRLSVSGVVAILMLIINQINLYSPVTVLSGFLLIAISQGFIYKTHPIKASILAVIFLLVIAVVDNIVVSSISYFLKIPTVEIYEEMSLYRAIAVISSKILLMLFTVVLNKLFDKKRVLKRKYLIILFVVTSVMFWITVALTFLDIKNEAVNSYFSILFFVIMLTLLLVIFFGTFILIDYYENQQKLKLIMLQNKMLEQSMAETEQTFTMWKTSLHDFKHKIMSLMTLAENNDMSGIRDYLEKENKLLGKKLFYYKTGNDTVDTILNIKQKIAENNGFIFMINARVPESCKISSVDFAVILGNLLDNAIEASSNEENPFIEVKIKPIEKFLVIAISNKYTKSDTFLNTTKSDKDFHGIGINSVKKTVKNYDGEYAFKVKDGIFHANIMIPL